MGTKNNPGKYDCYHKALFDEPMFTLLARDPQAAMLVRLWADIMARKYRSGQYKSVDAADKIAEAYDCANEMDKWRNLRRTPITQEIKPRVTRKPTDPLTRQLKVIDNYLEAIDLHGFTRWNKGRPLNRQFKGNLVNVMAYKKKDKPFTTPMLRGLLPNFHSKYFAIAANRIVPKFPKNLFRECMPHDTRSDVVLNLV